MIEGFGRRSPSFLVIAGSGEGAVGAWISATELRRLIDVARKILK